MSSPGPTSRHARAYAQAVSVVQASPSQTDVKTATNSARGRVVGREDEALEPALGDDAGRDQNHVHGVEEEQPVPCNPSVRQQPVVGQAIERDQRHKQQEVFEVPVIPEARPVDKLERDDKADEPASPDRNFGRVPNHVRVGRDG